MTDCSAYEKGNEKLKKKAEELENLLVMNAIALDGTCSGEHGVGIHKTVYSFETFLISRDLYPWNMMLKHSI
jgi:hypothetical protein